MRIRNFLIAIISTTGLAHAQDVTTTRYQIDTGESWIRVLVFRGGLMSRLGHNHVVSAQQIEGSIEIRTAVAESVVELRFPVSSLMVDDPEMRDIEGDDFPGHLSQKDIEGTRKNMLSRRLLDAAKFDVISVRSTKFCTSEENLSVTVDVSIRGETYPLSFPARLSSVPGTLTIHGTANIEHAQLGLKPFSAALGALKVKPQMIVKFELVVPGAVLSGEVPGC